MKLTESELKILDHEWKALIEQLNKRFESDLDLQGVLFLIGLQEIGLGFRKYKKDDKINVLHVAICTLLEPYGYYEYEGKDNEGWPHFKIKKQLPYLKSGEQTILIKKAILEYFKKQEE
jgi:hypothetical protein